MKAQAKKARLSFYLALPLLACVLLVWTRGDPSRAQPSGPDPTPVIPGMPSCCGQACTFPPDTPGATATPGLTATSLPMPTATIAATRKTGKVVALDPGHGGTETGAVSNSGLAEKDVNLRIGLKLAVLLRDGGYVPVLTRNSDRAVNANGRDLNGDGVVDNDDDLQARVDIANAAHADIIISIHNNGAPAGSTRGTTVYYCDARPFSAEDIRLAASLQTHLLGSIRAAGFDPVDNGTSDDAPLKKPFGHLFVLGPLTPRVARASNMPGALGETLYLTNPTEAAWLARDSMLSAIARGYYDGVVHYFQQGR